MRMPILRLTPVGRSLVSQQAGKCAQHLHWRLLLPSKTRPTPVNPQNHRSPIFRRGMISSSVGDGSILENVPSKPLTAPQAAGIGEPGAHLTFVTTGMACSPCFPAGATKPSANSRAVRHCVPTGQSTYDTEGEGGSPAPLCRSGPSPGVPQPTTHHGAPPPGLSWSLCSAMDIPSAGYDVVIADDDVEGPTIFLSVG